MDILISRNPTEIDAVCGSSVWASRLSRPSGIIPAQVRPAGASEPRRSGGIGRLETASRNAAVDQAPYIEPALAKTSPFGVMLLSGGDPYGGPRAQSGTHSCRRDGGSRSRVLLVEQCPGRRRHHVCSEHRLRQVYRPKRGFTVVHTTSELSRDILIATHQDSRGDGGEPFVHADAR